MQRFVGTAIPAALPAAWRTCTPGLLWRYCLWYKRSMLLDIDARPRSVAGLPATGCWTATTAADYLAAWCS
jgi:hypothetical protein